MKKFLWIGLLFLCCIGVSAQAEDYTVQQEKFVILDNLLSAQVKITNDTTNPLPVTAILAYYQEGRLADIIVTPLVFNGTETHSTNSLDLTGRKDGTAKLFLLNDLVSLQPIAPVKQWYDAYTFTMHDNLSDNAKTWANSANIWFCEDFIRSNEQRDGFETTVARRDDSNAEGFITYALTGNQVQEIRIDTYYHDGTGASLHQILLKDGFRFYGSSNNRDFTELQDITLEKQPSPWPGITLHRVIYTIRNLDPAMRYLKILFPEVTDNTVFCWTARIDTVDITYSVPGTGEYGCTPPAVPPGSYPSQRVTVVSPAYTSDIHGNTEIILCAPGLKSVTARCWKQGEPYGTDSVVATVRLDANGLGSFVFPADEYPHGPIVLRLMGFGDSVIDECHLQLYNTGGVSWQEGTNNTPVPPQVQVAGLSLVYEDDFDQDLSISWWDSTARYSSHKPGWGDFSGLQFENYDSWNNPFSQRDTYLRIRADENKNSTGLISSIHQDGNGFSVNAPCYFECKFVAQNAVGTWPAFWLLTKYPTDVAYPNDELDIIEAYGFDKINIDGFSNTRIQWGQPTQDGEIHFLTTSNIGGGGQWYTNFHTYGCLIDVEYTRYYFDNIEVWCHETMPVSKTEPWFFLVNYAIGGSSGWPIDLSRYNGLSDMYIDFVRVYAKP